jgi:glycerol-3-phosphate dehydrogenase (NAD(P)+)
MGGRAETVAGLSGLGDLALTCASSQSRNFAHGLALGKAERAGTGKTVEGAASAEGVVSLGQKWGVELPISETVAAIVADEITVSDAVSSLLQRPLALRE